MSQRLPGKALKEIGGLSILQRTIQSVGASNLVNSVVVATSDHESDRVILEHCADQGIRTFTGPLEDVGTRLLQAARMQSTSAFVRISGDSPFIDPSIIDKAIKLFIQDEFDLVTNVFHRTFPKGQSVEVIRTASLEKLCSLPRSPEQKEHVTTYFYENFSDFRILSFTSGKNSGQSRQCIDDIVDFQVAQKIFELQDVSGSDWQEVERLWDKASESLLEN